jgi:hypothetical protein
MEMISIYLEQTPHLLVIKQSLKEENWTLLGAAVHKMLPSFTIMFHQIMKTLPKIHDFTI